ncbi:site-specific integrase [Streptomyces sp. NBC_01387]|uniref:site-specific integrase n=1 Tax=unclassified Streptomyces TaxID=2593676 RepID=UPI002E336DED|nr:site-specific integrase [Streptomyces sp. NBC_01267]
MSIATERADAKSAEERAQPPNQNRPEAWPARPAAQGWSQTTLNRAEVTARLLELFTAPAHGRPRDTVRRRGLNRLLDWLEQQPGATWQDRWLASGADDAGRDWTDRALEPHAAGYHRGDLSTGVLLMVCGQVIRPSYRWLLAQRQAKMLAEARAAIDPGGFARLEALRPAGLIRTDALNRITWIALHKGGRVEEITVGDCLELVAALEQHHYRGSAGRPLFYALLAESGVLPANAPPRLRAAVLPGKRSIEQIIDGYGIVCTPVRDLLVDYFTERSADLDHNSVRSIAGTLCKRFWRDLEIHHPGIESLRLPTEVAKAWKERLQHVQTPGGGTRPRAGYRHELVFVRAFYQDIARWAADDPARWGPWVAPCPIKANECSQKKVRLRRKAAMDQRTRAQLPALPALVRAVERNRKAAEERLSLAKSAPADALFTATGSEFSRCRTGESGRVFVRDLATDKRRDLTHEEDVAFWAWAIVEVLRHTGIRIEELLELTHHSFAAYTLPTTDEVVPMLQIAPSKTDRERLLLVSPELGEVLTAIIFRVRAGHAALPLVSAYDVFEQVWSPPLPFLFQRRHGTEHHALTRSFVRTSLIRALATATLTDVSNQPLMFTPHDFRRLFITDAIRTGLPPHIAAVICGHQVLDTTMGYAAIYSDDVIAHHRAFIARRRAERPGEEYRSLTPDEWQEFLGHFELRKVALGICTRDYGSPCVHEHACVRCPQLRPDPDQMPRLEEIHDNLLDRLKEAKDQGWLGEVAAIEASVAAAEDKLSSMREMTAKHTTTSLGMPDFHPSVGRRTPGS